MAQSLAKKCRELEARIRLLEEENEQLKKLRQADTPDAGQQAQAEQALRASEERYRLLSELASDFTGVYRIDVDGKYVPERVSGIKQITGYTFEEISDRGGWDSILHPDDLSRVRQELQALLDEGRPYESEYRIITKTGETRWLHDRGHAIKDEQGRPVRFYYAARDITERKWIETELRRLKEFHESIIQNMAEGIITEDAAGYFTFVNPAAAAMLGYTTEALVGRHWTAIIPPDQQPLVYAADERREQAQSDRYELELARQDGRRITVLVSGSPRFEAGRFTGTTAVFTDITERKQVEVALQESNATLRTLIQSSPAAIIVLDTLGRVTLWNPAAERIFGWREAETLGRFNPLITALEMEEFQRYFALAQKKEVDTGLELRRRHKDGALIDVHLSTGPLRDAAGQLVGVIGIFIDVTERARTERLLHALNQAALITAQARTAEEVFTAAAEELKQIGFFCTILSLDESQGRLSTIYASYAPEVLDGIEMLLGVNFKDLSIPIDRIDVYQQVIRDKNTVLVENSEELLLQLLPGPSRGVARQMAKTVKVPKNIVAPLLVEGEIMGIFSVQADDLRSEDAPAITAFAHQLAVTWRRVDLLRDLAHSLEELKRTQDQLIQAQKMEAIGQLAGGVAHDFNNLLTAINGFAALMQLQLTPDSPLWEMTEKILDAGRRAAALVRQLLAFSRKQIIQPQPLNLNLIVADMEKMLRRLIGEDIQLEANLQPGLWLVNLDPTQIGQVIINLAVNARDAMPSGGKLLIETANVTLDARAAAGYEGEEIQPGEYVRLAVSDSGLGMSREVQAHLFEPFFTTKETGKGTGLGLAMVYGIVKQSGGVIQIQSEEGQGASFKIYLPRSEERAPPLPLEANQEMPTGNETVLLVEDDEDVRGLVRRVLQGQGYHLLEARSGQEALRLVADYRGFIHLLLTDVVMPEVGGKTLSEQLTASQPRLKVIYMSGYTGSAISHQGELDPQIPLLQKPFTPEELASKVRAVLDD